jgi:predicted signal transduction protein with EAL and GGDEF domain
MKSPTRRISGRSAKSSVSAFARPFDLESVCAHITASIGVAIYPNDGRDAETLMMAAESALYSAKADGRNLYKYYAHEMNEMGNQLFKLERMLRLALERNEFSVAYQPQINATSGQLVGVEALLRWQNPELGNVSPVQFIPVAEETGLIVPIGEWIMRVACRQARAWQTDLGVDIPVAVNLSARQFRRNDLLASVQTVLDETGLPSRLLELEITEGLLMSDPVGAIDIMRGLHCLGIKTALDDFGTGYSSLAYLKTFPLNRLKIDRAFVRDLPDNQSDCAISNTIIALGINLHMEVLAEGVETEAQRDFLTASGCQVFQGYLFGKPMPGEELTRRLQSGRVRAGAVRPCCVVTWRRSALDAMMPWHKPRPRSGLIAGVFVLASTSASFHLIARCLGGENRAALECCGQPGKNGKNNYAGKGSKSAARSSLPNLTSIPRSSERMPAASSALRSCSARIFSSILPPTISL